MPSQGTFKGFGRILNRKSSDNTANPAIDNSELSRAPGAGLRTQLDPWWWLVAAVALAIVLLVVFRSDPYWNMLVFVRDGIEITVFITVVSFIIMLLVGVIGGLGRISSNPIIRFFATLYVEIFRGIPLLVQLIWWYFAAPAVIIEIGSFLTNTFGPGPLGIFEALANYKSNAIVLAIAGLVVCYGAYMSEIFRAGIQSIPKGQLEAARSQGMTYIQSMRYVILPQAFRVVLPPVGNEFIMLIKDSSLVSVVAVADLTRRSREFMSTHFNPIETWTMAALLYLVLTLLFTRILDWLEKRRNVER